MILLWTTSSDSEIIYSYAKAYNAKKMDPCALLVFILTVEYLIGTLIH